MNLAFGHEIHLRTIPWQMDLGVVFIFKQKTAYEIKYGLVGSEMCIRDRPGPRRLKKEPGFPACGRRSASAMCRR